MRFLHIISKENASNIGRKYYVAPKLCTYGHFSERLIKNGGCETCRLIRVHAKKIADIPEMEVRRQKRKEVSREKQQERAREYYIKNREAIRLYQNTRRSDSPQDYKARDRIYYANNQKTIRAKQKVYREANPEIKRALHQKRRAIKSGAEGKFTSAEIIVLFEKQRGMCALCACKLKKSGENKFHMDHIQPLSKGGTNWISNIQLTCPGCNLKKNAKDPFEFAKQNGKLL